MALTTFDSEGLIPTIYTWSFGVQRELGRQTSVDVGYIGNTARHLQYRQGYQPAAFGTTTNTTILQQANNTANAVRPFKGYTNINFTDFGANSNYHALQARLSRRFANNLTMNANYTWSKAISEVDGDGTAIGYYLDRARERGPAGFDRRQVFTLDYVYQLPNAGTKWMNNAVGRTVFDGWQVSGITRFWSGTPLTITSNGDAGTLECSDWCSSRLCEWRFLSFQKIARRVFQPPRLCASAERVARDDRQGHSLWTGHQ